ncbi:MAG: O-antigen ligase family protein, partial [Acidobacteriota bacterium]
FCNYLSIGMMLLLAAGKLAWINKKVLVLLFVGIAICALFTVSPGLGGIALGLGLWVWLYNTGKRRLVAVTSLLFAVSVSVAFLFAVAISPNAQPEPQYYFDVPVIEKRIEPSARGLVWIDAWKTFTQNPITGLGLGQDAADVHYHAISGETHHLKDAHNMFLNVAAQQGILGLAAIVLICVYLTRKSFPTTADETNRGVLLAGIGIAFFNAFIYQGVGGSYEDTRFLWVLMGLILSTKEMPVLGSST